MMSPKQSYRIKQVPEDFVVDEIAGYEMGKGEFLIFKLKKKERNTQDVAVEMARVLDVKPSAIGWAGNKDKEAITTQQMSVRTRMPMQKLLERFSRIRNCEFSHIGESFKPISLGDLKGNRFIITVRALDAGPKRKDVPVPNYFDEQRFSKNNVQIGRLLVKREFKQAAELIIESGVQDSIMMERIAVNDFVGAIRKVPKKLLKLLMHSYQSFIYNETVVEYLKGFSADTVQYSLGTFRFLRQHIEDKQVPLVGFGMPSNPDFDKIIGKIMVEEQVKPRDFIIAQIPELSCEGGSRSLLAAVHELKMGLLEDDELNPGMKKMQLNFWLEPGSYATIIIRSLFS